MALAEYELHGRTYLFDVDHVPAGAKLVNSEVTAGKVNLFPDQTDKIEDEDKAEKPKRGRKPANKQAAAPENKADDETSDDKDADDESSSED